MHPSGDGGRQGIVAHAFSPLGETNAKENRFAAPDLMKFSEQHETDFIFALTELSHELTGEQRQKLGSCFKYYQLALRDNTNDNKNMIVTKI